MSHTTYLAVPGKRAWMIHNGDFSGPVEVHWTAEGGDDGTHHVTLPDGVLKAIVLGVVSSKLAGKAEAFLESDQGRRLVAEVLFR